MQSIRFLLKPLTITTATTTSILFKSISGNFKTNFFRLSQIKFHSTTATGKIPTSATNPLNTATTTNNLLTQNNKRKKKVTQQPKQQATKSILQVAAYSTADSYDLTVLREAFLSEGTYDIVDFDSKHFEISNKDTLCLKAKYNTIASSTTTAIQTNADNSRLIFVFEDGTCVFWNVNDLDERNNIFNLLNRHTSNNYDEDLINNEIEVLTYSLSDNSADAASGIAASGTDSGVQRTFLKNNHIYFKANDDYEQFLLEKYTFSDAISQSVKLGILENKLENFVEGIENVTHDLRLGRKFRLTSEQVLQKTGELMMMRHLINLRFDLLNTPDWYWDREQLENLYLSTIQFLDIGKRTRVYNEKLNHCIDLMRLLETNLNEKKHTRLEWCIIILIMVEAFFGMMSFFNNFNH